MEHSRKGEYGFMCPGRPGSGACDSARQGKVKLFVNPDQDRFHCWVCGFGGASLAILMVNGSAEQREYLESRGNARRDDPGEEKSTCTTLPDGFTPFTLDGRRSEAPYLTYLRSRGVPDDTTVLYRMGYAETGLLGGRVIVPSFDSFGMVNFWSARTIHQGALPSYRLPDASKDIISNDHMVDWSQPIYLVEGIFDEIAIGGQAIALYGKFLQSTLAMRLIERRPMVHICLDSDAKSESRNLMKRLVGYDVPCSIVDLGAKDPAVVGGSVVRNLAANSRVVSGSASLLASRGIG